MAVERIVLGPEVAELQAEGVRLAIENAHALEEWQTLSTTSAFAKCSICGCTVLVESKGGAGFLQLPECKIAGGVPSARCSGVMGVVGVRDYGADGEEDPAERNMSAEWVLDNAIPDVVAPPSN